MRMTSPLTMTKPLWKGDFHENDEDSEGVYVTYSDDESLDALLQEIPWDDPEDTQLAEAYATVAQHRMQKRGQGFSKKVSSGSSTMTVPFKAQGDFSFDQRAKEQRARATNFLKSVTQCTACLQRGHWVGDPECPKGGKKGKGKASPKRKPVAPTGKKKTQPANFFVLHEEIQSEGEGDIKVVFSHSPDALLDPPGFFPGLDKDTKNDYEPNANVNAIDAAAETSGDFTAVQAILADGKNANRFTDSLVFEDAQIPGEKINSVLMVLKLDKDTDLCQHSSYNGGEEKHYHRGANGYTRHVICRRSFMWQNSHQGHQT